MCVLQVAVNLDELIQRAEGRSAVVEVSHPGQRVVGSSIRVLMIIVPVLTRH